MTTQREVPIAWWQARLQHFSYPQQRFQDSWVKVINCRRRYDSCGFCPTTVLLQGPFFFNVFGSHSSQIFRSSCACQLLQVNIVLRLRYKLYVGRHALSLQTICVTWPEIFVIHEPDQEPDSNLQRVQRLRCEDEELQSSGSSVIGIWNDPRKSSSWWWLQRSASWVQVVLTQSWLRLFIKGYDKCESLSRFKGMQWYVMKLVF